MNLYIDTTDNDFIFLAVFSSKGNLVLKRKKIKALRKQSEKLLPSISKILEESKIKLKDIRSVVVNNNGGSFTSLRIGVLTANALAYSLGVKVFSGYVKNNLIEIDKKTVKKFKITNIVNPIYESEPNIGKSKAC